VIVDTERESLPLALSTFGRDEPAELVARLRKQNVGQAGAGSFDGILHKDITGVNTRLTKDCRAFGHGMLVPFGSINPKFPDCQEDVRRCQEEHKMPGIRLHPNYHGYTLDDPAFEELLKLALTCRMIVQLVLSMEDVRTQHPLMRVPPVDVAPLAELVKHQHGLRLVVLNWTPGLQSGELQTVLAPTGHVYFDISTVEGVGGVAHLVEQVSLERVLFGSNYPLFYFESALLKMQESGLIEAQKNALFEENGRLLLAPTGREGYALKSL